MYTTYQLATIDTVNQHVGFYFILFFILLAAWVYTSLDDVPFERILILFLAIFGVPAAYISWHTGEITTFANKPVICNIVNFWGEVHNEQRQSGKTTTTVSVHNQYVSYKTPDGVVSFPMVSGMPYPDTVILYKN